MGPSSLFAMPPPEACQIRPKADRLDTESKRAMYDEMLAHFSAENFAVDSTMDIDGVSRRQSRALERLPLNEEERKFLVSTRFDRYLHCAYHVSIVERMPHKVIYRLAEGVRPLI